MNKICWNICLLASLFLVLLLASCKGKEVEREQNPVTYAGSGAYWDVVAELSEKDEQITMEFSFKSDIEKLKKQERLKFFAGTRIGTYSYTFLDEALNEGDSTLEYDFIDFENINSTTFTIPFPDATRMHTVKEQLDAIEMDGILIYVTWGKGGTSYKDRIRVPRTE